MAEMNREESDISKAVNKAVNVPLLTSSVTEPVGGVFPVSFHLTIIHHLFVCANSNSSQTT